MNPEQVVETVWQARCPKCLSDFEMDKTASEMEGHPGTLCPSCRDLGLVLLGVLNWKDTGRAASQEVK